jgi:hypothetical protein
MNECIGCGLVSIAFVLLRYIMPHFEINTSIMRRVFYHCGRMLSFGFLIAGLVLSFLSDVGIGVTLLGFFLWIYKNSFVGLPSGFRFVDSHAGWMYARLYGIPILANRFAGIVGFVLYLLGLILMFTASLLRGSVVIVVTFLAVQVVVLLNRLEWKYVTAQVRKDYDTGGGR